MRYFLLNATIIATIAFLPYRAQALELNEQKAHAVCTQKRNGGWKCDGPLQKVSFGKKPLKTALKQSGCPGGKTVGRTAKWQIFECAGEVGRRDILKKYGISKRRASARKSGPSRRGSAQKSGPSRGIINIVTKGAGRLCNKNVKIGRTWFSPQKAQGVIQLKFNKGMVILKFEPGHFPKKGEKIGGRSIAKLMPTNLRTFEVYALSMLAQGCDRLKFRKGRSKIIPYLKGKVRRYFMKKNGARDFYGDKGSYMGVRG